MSNKKKNPHIQLKQSKIDKIKLDATNEGLKGAIILFFSVMRDKEGYGENVFKGCLMQQLILLIRLKKDM